jgi:hypothetical protein
MIDVEAKYDHSKTDTSKFDRRFAVSPLQGKTQSVVRQGPDNSSLEDRLKTDAEFGASKGGVEPVPHSAAANNDAPTLNDVDVPDANGGAGRAAGSGDISPGKDLGTRESEVSSVSTYASAINGHWQRGVDAFMHIARLCAEASARLTTAQKKELIQALPFGDTAFSKFAQIGNDTRLHTPEMQRLLPPHYTTTYAVTLLTDEELKRAIAENVIYPDMKREELQRWRNSHRELPITVGLALSPQEKLAGQDERALGPLSPGDAPAPEAVATAVANSQAGSEVRSPDVMYRVAVEAVAPSMPPLGDEVIPAFLDRRPLSPEDQRAFDAIKAAWDSHLQLLWNSASEVVRERIEADVIRAHAHAIHRDGDPRSAMLAPPTTSEASVHAADAGNADEEAQFSAPPAAADGADAGIKYSDVQVPGCMTVARPVVVIRRKRRRPRKMWVPLDEIPF